jgi:hypothetical protein
MCHVDYFTSLQGLSSALNMPVQGTITAHWSPLSEAALFMAWQNCYFQVRDVMFLAQKFL